MIYNFFDKKASATRANKFSGGADTGTNKSAIKSEIMPNQHPLHLAYIAKVFDRTR